MNKVDNCDNLEFMQRFEDKYFDLVVADPPYGINVGNMSMGSNPNRSRNDGHGSGPGVSIIHQLKGRLNTGSGKLKNRILNKSSFSWDNEIPSDRYFNELFRVSKNQIIFGGNYFPLPPTRCLVVWDKLQPWDNFSQFELAWTSFDKPCKMFRFSNTGGANKEKKIHPTQKPVSLYKYLYQTFSFEGAKVFDPNTGSGSSRIAAHDMKMDYYGCEIDKSYFLLQEDRFNQHISQLKIF